MRARVITALILAVLIVIAILYSPPGITALVLSLILLVGSWEWSAFLAVGFAGRVLYVALMVVVGLLGRAWLADPLKFQQLMMVSCGWWVLALLWILLAPTRVGRVAAAGAGLLALLPTWIALLHIDAQWERGAQWTLFVLVLSFAADTGAYFTGRRFGRLPLAPRVSPRKTWEGALGGMLLGLVVSAFGSFWFGLPPARFLPLCLAAAAFSIVGDLTESMLKRHVNLKDSGRVFPGHGGVLDRIDSVSAATPVMTLGLIWLGVGA